MSSRLPVFFLLSPLVTRHQPRPYLPAPRAFATVVSGEHELGLLDGNAGPLPSKIPRNVALGAAILLAVASSSYIFLRFHTEKATVRLFLSQVAAGDYQSAYGTWKPASSYSFQDFLRDWGPTGEYGPVKSYDLRSVRSPAGASGVIVTVAVSAVSPFPEASDPKSRDAKEVRLWVERSDQSISYAPLEIRISR